jgi:hypothetical protein
MTPIIILSIFYLAIGLLCWTRPNAGRIFIGLFFWAMAIGVNGYFIVANPQGYVDFANAAHFAIYRDLFVPIVEFSPQGFGITLALFEITVGALLLSHGRFVKIGLIAGIVFLISITPLIAMTLPNLILAAVLGYLMTKDFDVSLWEMAGSWFRSVQRHRMPHQM